MPKKPKEKEMEVDLSTRVKKETFSKRWFRDYAVNNADDLKIVCELTARMMFDQFKINVRTENQEVYAVIFYGTFITLLEFLRSKEKTYHNFTIRVAKSLNIGYCNNDDDENEKVGNFMPIMEYLGPNPPIVIDESIDSLNVQSCNLIRWSSLNDKKNAEYFKEIQSKATERLRKEYRVILHTEEMVIPAFCIFLDNCVNVLKLRYREALGTDISEVSMNVLGLFDIYYSYDDEAGREIIEFEPNITMKLALKNDSAASID